MGRGGRRRLPRGRALRAVALAGVVVVAALGSTACSGGGGGDRPSAGGTRAGDSSAAAEVTTVTMISRVSGGPLGSGARQQAKAAITRVVDQWIDHGYLGSFPRDSYSSAFDGFTRHAAALAEQDLDVMTGSAVSDRITTATATNRRVRLTLLAPQGAPSGATARIVLDVSTTGELEEDLRVLGQLYLTKTAGQPWRVFGFRVDEPVRR